MKRRCTLFVAASVWLAAWAQSPCVSKVWEYCPAPGQFVNVMPEYEEGDTSETLRRKAEEYIVGQSNGSLLSLGAWGGYIVVGFDHTIANVPGENDFKIYGNAFYSAANPDPDAPKGGSCEPGIVMVSRDANGNGLPDDLWYELAGSEYHNPLTRHSYRVVYSRPRADKPATPHPTDANLTDTSYIAWHDNVGGQGYVPRLAFHSQSYWPEWSDADSLVFEGSRLPDNAVDESGTGSYYVLYAYDRGYADNHPNDDDLSCFDIGWAVDADGQPVYLPGIDFIKVYTGVLQMNGWLGECSTEISGMVDLHPDREPAATVGRPSADGWKVGPWCDEGLLVDAPCRAKAVFYSMAGLQVADEMVEAGNGVVPLKHLPAGVYVVHIRAEDGTVNVFKTMKR